MANSKTDVSILDLSDYPLLEILQFLNLSDLYHLSRTCQRFHDLVQGMNCNCNRKIDARGCLNTPEKISYCLKMINQATDDLRLCADGRHIQIIPDNFAKSLASTNLTVMALENQHICGDTISMVQFPKSLIELSLRKTYVTNSEKFLADSLSQMEHLKVLILDQCFWVKASIFFTLEKYASLEILSLYKCKNLFDWDVLKIMGFDQLRLVDCRFSRLSDNFFRGLTTKSNLQEVYFQSYFTTYNSDIANRHLEIASGCQPKLYSYFSDLDDISLWDKDAIKFYVGREYNTVQVPFGDVSDRGTLLYLGRQTKESSYELNSLLYENPYRECNCWKNPPLTPTQEDNKKPHGKVKRLIKKTLSKAEDLIRKQPPPTTTDVSFGKKWFIHFLSGAEFFDRVAHGPKDEQLIALLEHLANGEELPACRRQHDWCAITEMRVLGDRRRAIYATSVSLKKLSLRGCKNVTDITLEHVGGLHLTLLDVTTTEVTAEGVARFMYLNPQCRVIHESVCKCRPNMHF